MAISAPLVVAVSLLVAAGTADARCGGDPGDAAAIAAARAEIDATCDCAGPSTRRVYVACAASVAKQRIADGSLPRGCRGAVKRCASRSTCGRPGAVTCCVTSPRATRCKVMRDAALCAARGGTVGGCSSCCDACSASGCPTSTTTTTSTTSSTTTTLFVCGNGVAEAGEACDGTDDTPCPGDCQPDCTCLGAVCGDDRVNQADEECDGTDREACAGLSCDDPAAPHACRCCSPAGQMCFPSSPCCGEARCIKPSYFAAALVCVPPSCTQPLECGPLSQCVDGTCCASPGQPCRDLPCCPGSGSTCLGDAFTRTCCGPPGWPCGPPTPFGFVPCCSGSCNAGSSTCD